MEARRGRGGCRNADGSRMRDSGIRGRNRRDGRKKQVRTEKTRRNGWRNHAAFFFIQQRRLINATIRFFDFIQRSSRDSAKRSEGQEVFTCVGHREVDVQ